MIRKKQIGFTIVELLIVIVVIGVLAAITIVAYNGIQTRSLNAARNSTAKQFHTILEIYYAANGEYPALALDVSGTVRGACLGTEWPERNGENVCWDIDRPDGTNGPSTFLEDPAVNTALAKHAQLPNFPIEPLIVEADGPGGMYKRAGIVLIFSTSSSFGLPDGGYPQGYSLAWILDGLDATCASGATKTPLYSGAKDAKCVLGLRGSVR